MLDRINNDAQNIARSESATDGNFNNFRFPLAKKKSDVPTHLPFDRLPFAAERESINNWILSAALSHGFDNLLPHLERISLCAGTELYAAGEANDYVYFPETAVISHLYNLADGNTIETAMVGRNGGSGLCALFSPLPAAHHALVIIGGNARRIKTKILRQELARGGKLQMLLLDYFSAHLAQVSQRVVCASFHLIEKRLCSWLLMLHDRADKNQLSLTHEQIAQFLGVNRPTVSVIAKKLRNKGLINYLRGKFYILDRRGLMGSACECYSTVQTIL